MHRPGHGVTVAHLFHALFRDPALLAGLRDLEGLGDRVRRRAYAVARVVPERSSRL